MGARKRKDGCLKEKQSKERETKGSNGSWQRTTGREKRGSEGTEV